MAKRYYDDGRAMGGQMISNDSSKVANMPTEMKQAYYPENPSYYPDTEINDTMSGSDAESRSMRNAAGLVKGRVS